MLKMTVRPLAIRNSSMPYSTPLSVEMTISSSTASAPDSSLLQRRHVEALVASQAIQAFEQERLDCFVASLLAMTRYFGRSILQVVGSTVWSASILATVFQPHPVFSSSNTSFSLRSPNEAMYIGWKNWWSSLRIDPLPPS